MNRRSVTNLLGLAPGSSLLCFALAASVITSPISSAKTAETMIDPRLPLALVGADTVTVADLDAEMSATLAASQGAGQKPKLDPEGVLRRLIQNRLLEQEGYRTGADQVAQVQNQVLDFVRLQGVKALMDSVSAPPPGTAPASPDTLPRQIKAMRRYSHILTKDEDQARALRDSLARGVAFAELARRHSTDQSAAQGGDLGWAAQDTYVSEFEKAARPLSLHEVAGPVKTQYGWHLIILTGARTDTLSSKSMAGAMINAQESRRRNAAIEDYVLFLKKKYAVTVNDSLLAGLDYGSSDPTTEKTLQTDERVLAVLPTGQLTIRGLTRNIRFQYFHGLAGRPDAAAIRDRMFNEWLTEALLSHESHLHGLDRTPKILAESKRLERRQVREEVLKSVLSFEFKPDEEQVRSYYQGHLADFTPKPRIKVRGVLLANEEAARRFREQLDGGAGFKWLVGRTPEVAAAASPFPTDWLPADQFEVKGQPLAEGSILGPLALPNGSAVGEVIAVEKTEVPALDKCRADVLQAVRRARTHEAIQSALARLESATTVVIEDGAPAIVAARLLYWIDAPKEGGTP
jgi:peptidyl-prolyl cis-trans isomerase C